jgi:hypothetical protein
MDVRILKVCTDHNRRSDKRHREWSGSATVPRSTCMQKKDGALLIWYAPRSSVLTEDRASPG